VIESGIIAVRSCGVKRKEGFCEEFEELFISVDAIEYLFYEDFFCVGELFFVGF
jgi:hypothetical protein